MQKITPCIWYNQNALEAANFYVDAFENSQIEHVVHYIDEKQSPSNLPAGTPLTVRFALCGQEFVGVNGGPVFRPTPAISFFVDCESQEQFDQLWDKLATGGQILMEVGEYPFSKRFGWVADAFGVSWQLSLSEKKQMISPYLMFIGKNYGKAEEAMAFYAKVLGSTSEPFIQHNQAELLENKPTVMLAAFDLAGQPFLVADNSYAHAFEINEGISFVVYCDSQSEIDTYWELLTDGGAEQPCGWLKDRFGVSWQINPRNIEELSDSDDPIRSARVNAALMKMKKINIQALQDAYNQK
jgi:Uncharacterized protein conserved in bacteria